MPPTTTAWQRALYLPLAILAWAAVLVLAGWLLSHVLKALVLLAQAGILAFALAPLSRWLARWLPRPLALTAAYALGISAVLGFGAFLVVTVVGQLTALVNNLPYYAEQAAAFEPTVVGFLGPFGVTTDMFRQVQSALLTQLQALGLAVAAQSLTLLTTLADTLVDVVVVFILSVYLGANGSRIAGWLQREAPSGQRHYVRLLIVVVSRVVGGYVRGTLTLALLVGSLVGTGLSALAVPYALLLGVLAFSMEFIPFLGVIISGATSVLVALAVGWQKALLVLGYFVLVHIIEGEVVGPRIMGHAVGIHPATGLLALVAGTELFGVWGALFAAPVAGLLQALGTAIWLELRGAAPREVLRAVAPPEEQPSQQAVDGR